MTARFRHRNRSTEVMAGPLLRIDVPDYAEASFREALANALVHRDYATLGAVHVQWHPDHLRVDSPGGFPEGVRLDNLLVTRRVQGRGPRRTHGAGYRHHLRGTASLWPERTQLRAVGCNVGNADPAGRPRQSGLHEVRG